MQKIFSLLAAIAAILLSAPATYAQADSVKTVLIKVTNLHCGNDMPTIKKRLLNQDGIDDVTFTELSHESSMFTITYHTTATGREKIEKAIESTPGCDDKNDTPYRVKKEGANKRRGS